MVSRVGEVSKNLSAISRACRLLDVRPDKLSAGEWGCGITDSTDRTDRWPICAASLIKLADEPRRALLAQPESRCAFDGISRISTDLLGKTHG